MAGRGEPPGRRRRASPWASREAEEEEVIDEPTSDKLVPRAKELGVSYEAAKLLYGEGFHDGFGDYAALKAENERLQKERDEWAKVAHDLSIELAKAKGNKK